jgi:hypothetical protein
MERRKMITHRDVRIAVRRINNVARVRSAMTFRRRQCGRRRHRLRRVHRHQRRKLVFAKAFHLLVADCFDCFLVTRGSEGALWSCSRKMSFISSYRTELNTSLWKQVAGLTVDVDNAAEAGDNCAL